MKVTDTLIVADVEEKVAGDIRGRQRWPYLKRGFACGCLRGDRLSRWWAS